MISYHREGILIQERVWIKSGVIEALDQRQIALLKHVQEQIEHYYRELYQTRPCFDYPLSLSRLMKLTNRSGSSVTAAIRYLANTIPAGSSERPTISYDRISSERNPSHRPYRIWLRERKPRGQGHD